MKFWDAAAVVPLVVAEEATSRCRTLLAEDPEMVVWFFTPVEVISALTRRRREGSLQLPDLRRARAQLVLLERAWSEVIALERIRTRARRVLETHPLRAADALQLAAALLACEDHSQDLPFVTLDRRLALAAEQEGFPVLGIQV